MSHRVTYFFFHSLFRDLPLLLSRMPWGQRPHQRWEPGVGRVSASAGSVGLHPHPPRSLCVWAWRRRAGWELNRGGPPEPTRPRDSGPPPPVTVDHCPMGGAIHGTQGPPSSYRGPLSRGGGTPYPRLWAYICNGRQGSRWPPRISRGGVEHRDLRGPWPPNPCGSPRRGQTST